MCLPGRSSRRRPAGKGGGGGAGLAHGFARVPDRRRKTCYRTAAVTWLIAARHQHRRIIMHVTASSDFIKSALTVVLRSRGPSIGPHHGIGASDEGQSRS